MCVNLGAKSQPAPASEPDIPSHPAPDSSALMGAGSPWSTGASGTSAHLQDMPPVEPLCGEGRPRSGPEPT